MNNLTAGHSAIPHSPVLTDTTLLRAHRDKQAHNIPPQASGPVGCAMARSLQQISLARSAMALSYFPHILNA